MTRGVGAGVTLHKATEENQLGQSGLHTIVDDVISVVLNSDDEAMAWKKLHEYFASGQTEV